MRSLAMLVVLALGACHRGERTEPADTVSPDATAASRPWYTHASVAPRYHPDASCSPPPPVAWPPEASPYLRRLILNCDAGDVDACRRAGDLRASGDGGPSDAQHALSLYMRACGGGVKSACANVAELFRSGRGTVANEACGARFEAKAGGETYSRTRWWGKDLSELKQACADGSWAACVWAEQQWDDPLKQVGQYCARGVDHACREIRTVGAASPALTQTYVEGCQRGSRFACSELLYPERSRHRIPPKGESLDGVPFRVEPDFELSDRAALVRVACATGLGHACGELARQDPTNAIHWLERGCPAFARDIHWRDVDLDTCAAWGDALLAAGETDAPFRAAAAYQRGCYTHRGSERACLAFAKLLAEGRGALRPDPARAEFVGADLCSIDVQHCRTP